MKENTFKVLAGDFPMETIYTYLLGSQYISYPVITDGEELTALIDLGKTSAQVYPLMDRETAYGPVADDERVVALVLEDGRSMTALVDEVTFGHILEAAQHGIIPEAYANSFQLVHGGKELLNLRHSI